MLLATFVSVFLLWLQQGLNALAGALLLCLLVVTLWLLAKNSTQQLQEDVSEMSQAQSAANSTIKYVLLTLIALVFLLLSAQLLVYAATNLARLAGLSELVIGLTIVAIGTSLPELAAAMAAALKKQTDVILGNIIGSNIFNLLAVLPLPALFGGFIIEQSTLQVDVTLMLLLAVSLPILACCHRQRLLARFAGGVFLSSYVAYLFYLGVQHLND